MLKDLYLVLTGRLSSFALRVALYNLKQESHRFRMMEEQRDFLLKLLGQIDEDTFRLSQCSSAEEMQSILGPMADQAMARRKHESDQIGAEVIGRLRTENRRRLEQHL